ncbi:MAG: ATP/GTP-binding protein, partial [Acidimicrobiaceae bacterium]|nr:ATP/GTP-binding protein [Acidimicrobiaceae bacterium]
MTESGPDQLASLEGELNTWRKTMFGRLDRRGDAFPALKEAVRRAGGGDQKQVELEDVRALLIAVVAAAEANEPPDVTADRRARYSRPAVIREVFGLTVFSKDANAKDRFVRAGEAVDLKDPVPHDTMRNNPGAYARQLATWIREYLDQQQRAAEVAPVAETSLLVARDDDLAWLHATYRDLVQRGGGVFQLWGIAGVGKTTLATQFAGQIGPEKVIGIIRVGRRGLFEDDLRRVLGLEGHDTSAWSDEHCEARFRAVVSGRLRSIRLLIFDGVDDPSDVIALVPKGVTVPLLITSRERLRFPEDVTEQLRTPPARRVKTFSEEQSRHLLRGQVADLDVETADSLA